jgi:hypothetical protein
VAVPCNERIENIVLRDRTNLIFVVVCTGLIAEYILPWAAIWLSDIFFYDIPPWLPWLLIGGPSHLAFWPYYTPTVMSVFKSSGRKIPPGFFSRLPLSDEGMRGGGRH